MTIDLRTRWVDVKAEGAAADGVTDDSAAIQGAITTAGTGGRLYFPNGTYQATGLTQTLPGQVWMGESRQGAVLQSSAGDLLTVGSGSSALPDLSFEQLTFRCTSTGGHIFVNSAGGVVRASFRNIIADQQATGKSIWQNGDNKYIACSWQHFMASMPAASTVPGFNYVTSTTRVNANTWQDGWLNNCGTWFFLIECDSAGTYNYDNVFRDIVGEVNNAGIAKILTGFNTIFENVNAYDMTTTTQDTFVIDKGTGGLISRNTVFRRVGRRAGGLGAALSDIKIVTGGAQGVLIEGAQNATLSGYTIDLGTVPEVTLIALPSNVTVNNVHANTIRTGRSGGSISTGAGITANRPGTPGTYDQFMDTTLHKPIWWDGAAWRDAAGTVV